MWLVNTRTLKLEPFTDASAIDYAILSHTWGDQEISFQDMAKIEAGNRDLKNKAGYAKIQDTCELARRDHLDYAWIDSCSIDKNSSAELSEAINSMFSLYKKSKVCYVYLSDLELDSVVHQPGANERDQPDVDGEDEEWEAIGVEEEREENGTDRSTKDGSNKQLRRCRWFYRSWTLQELIAPKRVELYNKNWKCIGCKGPDVELDQQPKAVDLTDLLAAITSIDRDILLDDSLLSQVPVARRLSWAASREATRIEDEAYSLMGIFDVNMPLLYGEGYKAFLRLQEHIFHETHDLSLFAWKQMPGTGVEYQYFRGIFAISPHEFWASSNLRTNKYSRGSRHDYKLDGDCLQIPISCQNEETLEGQQPTSYFLDLDCVGPSDAYGTSELKRQNSSDTQLDESVVWLSVILTKHGHEFVRASPERFSTTPSRLTWNQNSVKRPVRIRKYLPQAESFGLLDIEVQKAIIRATVDFDSNINRSVRVHRGLPLSCWSPPFFKGRPDLFFIEFTSDGDGDDVVSMGILPFTLKIRQSQLLIHFALLIIVLTNPSEISASESGQYAAALFHNSGDPEDPSSRIVSLAHCIDENTSGDAVASESHILDEMRDQLFVNYENIRGGLSHKKLPTSVEVHDEDADQSYTVAIEKSEVHPSIHQASFRITHSVTRTMVKRDVESKL